MNDNKLMDNAKLKEVFYINLGFDVVCTFVLLRAVMELFKVKSSMMAWWNILVCSAAPLTLSVINLFHNYDSVLSLALMDYNINKWIAYAPKFYVLIEIFLFSLCITKTREAIDQEIMSERQDECDLSMVQKGVKYV